MKKMLLILAGLCLFVSCKKDKKDSGETSETPAATTGTLSGKITHYDQFGTTYTSGLNTATVSLEGTNFSTTTDASGKYQLTNIPAGTYTLMVKKTGCGLIKSENVFYKIEDTVTYNLNIADLPSFTLSSAYAKDTTWFNGFVDGIFYGARPATPNANASIVAIIGKNSNITLADPASYINYAQASRADSLDYARFFSYQLLKNTYTFKKDSVLYMKIYPVSAKGASYLNNTLNTPVYTAYGTPYTTVFMLNIK